MFKFKSAKEMAFVIFIIMLCAIGYYFVPRDASPMTIIDDVFLLTLAAVISFILLFVPIKEAKGKRR